MVTPDALRLKRSLQLAGLVAASALAVLGSVRISAGIQGSGLRSLSVVGTVTSVGDGITVDDDTYSTSDATFQIDGKPGKKAQLHPGDVVSLSAQTSADGSQASASAVTFNGSVEGPVSGLDTQSGSFFVLQQTVHVNSDTIFGAGISPSSLAGLQNGALVQVSGFANSAGELVASRIDQGRSGFAQVVGAVQALDATRGTFRINSLTVDYSGAVVDGALTEGGAVAARGTTLGADGTLLATQVEVLPVVRGAPNADGRIEGLITSFASSAYFEINGQPVAVDANTKLKLKQALGLDVHVKATGTFDVNGVLVASKLHSYK
jgi:Domain of unknown function (DUF5666)